MAFEADETLAAQALVAAGVGVTLLPRMALTAVHPGAVARALKDAPVRRVLAARVEGAFHSPASDAMLQILRDVAGEFSGPRLELRGELARQVLRALLARAQQALAHVALVLRASGRSGGVGQGVEP